LYGLEKQGEKRLGATAGYHDVKGKQQKNKRWWPRLTSKKNNTQKRWAGRTKTEKKRESKGKGKQHHTTFDKQTK